MAAEGSQTAVADRPFRVNATHHTSFTVSDIERTLQFFREVLDFPTSDVHHVSGDIVGDLTGVAGATLKLAFVTLPGHALELVEYDAPGQNHAPVASPAQIGAAHIALCVDDLDAGVDRCVKAGLSLAGKIVTDESAGARSAYLRSDLGFIMELIQLKG